MNFPINSLKARLTNLHEFIKILQNEPEFQHLLDLYQKEIAQYQLAISILEKHNEIT